MDPANRPTGWGGPPVTAPDLAEIKTAAQRISTVAVHTPLVPMHSYDGTTDIWLKPEVLQPIGSFKLRGVYNWAAGLSAEERERGLVTTSAGNTAQALGYVARLFGVTARTLVPDWLPENKMASILNYSVTPVQVPLDDLLAYMFEERWRQEPYSYLNPWGEPKMISGHGTIGLEIIEDLPDVALVSEEDVKSAIRHLALRNSLVVEGAGAVSVAAALAMPLRGKTVCILSGGSIDTALLRAILANDET